MAQKVFFPNLDGLRFFAFLAVFFAHSFYTEIPEIKEMELHGLLKSLAVNGIYGVNFFFVLSGFLITYLLLDEQARTNTINIKAFYMRRILRIWPLYFAVVFTGFVIVPYAMQLMGEAYEEKSELIYYLLFINNLAEVKPATAILGVLWSIAIEEQFYLVWPVIIYYVPSRYYHWVFAFIMTVSFVFRIFHPEQIGHTLYCISDMALGGWVAYLCFHNSKIITEIASFNKLVVCAIYIGGFTMIFTKNSWNNSYIDPFVRIFYGVFFAYIIVEQNYGKHSFFKMSVSSFISFWGKYTYGLYMLHFSVIYAVGKVLRTYYTKTLFDVAVVETVVTFVISLGVAYLSYHLFETPFLKLKEKFAYYNSKKEKM
jgi:peptidoglycan/LPS O-acetylase OafA/YrhL